MSKKEEYEKKLEVIKSIGSDKIISPSSIPVDVYVQEADNVYHWCQEDKEELMKAGLDWATVDDIPSRSDALSYAESLWVMERFSQEEAQRKWKLESPVAYNLRNELIHYFRFAFRKDDAISGRVDAIAEGSSHADMIQDLNDLSVLGKANPDFLTKINFDMTLLDKAEQISSEIASVLAMAVGDRMEYSETKKIRDQAFTFLKEAVDEIRDFGQFLFWRNPERIKGYVSIYLQKSKNKYTKKKAEKTTTKTTGETPKATEEKKSPDEN